MSYENTTISKEGFVFEELVIGNTLEAALYCKENDRALVFNKDEEDYTRALLKKDSEEALNCCIFDLALSGRLIYFKSLQSIRDKINKLSLIASPIETVELICDRIVIFDAHLFYSESVLVEKFDKFRVYDTFSTKGLPVDANPFEIPGSSPLFVHPYLSQRIDGNTKYKDLLCLTELTSRELYDFDNSDTMHRFAIENYIKTKWGKKVKLESLVRSVFPVRRYKIIENERIIDGRKL